MTVPNYGSPGKNVQKPPAPKPHISQVNSMQLYSEAAASGNPSLEGMARSLASAENDLGLIRRGREMKAHIQSRKAAAAKKKQQ